MPTLQFLGTRLTLNKFSTHREASIGFLKYVSTGLTLQYVTKKRITSALMNVDITVEDIITPQQTTENNIKTLTVTPVI